MDEVQLAERLARIEANADSAAKIAVIAVQATADAAVARHSQVLEQISAVRDEVKGVKEKVGEQNGRISRLETWKTQQGAAMTLLLAAAPFIFWALNRWAGG